ncbi:MAG TPA: UDP-N-acetylmuramoyl-L-alanyl-D-glutamate--2,6-diaminopimelate ligase [Candidatus Avidehalobacter gallistercoris]|uniref:UDP-N-acetylmuramoyl-L-alanyl-D-glutamate--2,6-diaminopimelate ligase n=1 Tax=Candidatus Avidehalobacter gallistercoris TaxID=2840694 RepID=A0A9D1HN74_9FIRM|nr:UDP-N-acetylmuramoyl-L-alanyl-D-glutamate--2,6-diaminopimelate ligase [Candidatus Avidehalobacter gallistercoris]
MRLRDIAVYLGIDPETVPDIRVKNLQYDSRTVQPEDVFIALVGTNVDGHDYIEHAVANGAVAVIAEYAPESVAAHTPVLVVKDTREVISLLAELLYDFPDKKLNILGVTGTNGKTTTTNLVRYLWQKRRVKCGLIGTICNYCGERKLPAGATTPEPLHLAELLSMMVEDECTHVVMEVSSHALKQKRVDALHFNGAVFTNLTQDHLDYHVTVEDYLNAKLQLFRMLDRNPAGKGFAVVNADDPHAGDFINASHAELWTYGIDNPATLQAQNYHLTGRGAAFEVLYQGKTYQAEIPLSGKFNVYNSLAALAAMLAQGFEISDLLADLKDVPQVAGRFEKVDCGQDFAVVVDYAHTPDGLENVLKTAREITRGKLIVVFGCGGDRDRGKRPIMGKLAAALADYAIVTSDNPRTEDPLAIIAAIEAGIKELDAAAQTKYEVQADRRLAIGRAIELAEPGDVVLIAGKGHEDYQLVNGRVLDFDDRKVAREFLTK